MDNQRAKMPALALKKEDRDVSAATKSAADTQLCRYSVSEGRENVVSTLGVALATSSSGALASIPLDTVTPQDSETSQDSGVAYNSHRQTPELENPQPFAPLPVPAAHPPLSYGKGSRGGPNPKTAEPEEPNQIVPDQEANQRRAKKNNKPKAVIHEDHGFPEGWHKYDEVMRDQQFNYWISEDARVQANANARPKYTVPPDEAFAGPSQDQNLPASSQPQSLSRRDEPSSHVGHPIRKDRYSFMNAKALKQELQNRRLFHEYSFHRTTAAADYHDARQALRNDDANTRRTQTDKTSEDAQRKQRRSEDEAARIKQEEDEQKTKASAEAYWKRQAERSERTRQRQELAEASQSSKGTEQQQQKQPSTSSNSTAPRAPPKKRTLLSQLLSEIDPTAAVKTSTAGFHPPAQTQRPRPASSGPSKASGKFSENKIQESKTKLDKQSDSKKPSPTSSIASYARSTKASEARRNIPLPASVKSNATKPPKKISRTSPTLHTADLPKAAGKTGNHPPVTSLNSASLKNSAPLTGRGSVLPPLKSSNATVKIDTEPESVSKPSRRRSITDGPHRKQEAAKVESGHLTEAKKLKDIEGKEEEPHRIARAVTTTQDTDDIDGKGIDKVKDDDYDDRFSHNRNLKSQPKRKASDSSDQNQDRHASNKRQRIHREDSSDGGSNHNRGHTNQPKRKRGDSISLNEDGDTLSKRQRTHHKDGTGSESGSGSSHGFEHNKSLKRRRSDSSDQSENNYTRNKRQRSDSEEDDIQDTTNSGHKRQPTKSRKKYNKPWRNPFINL